MTRQGRRRCGPAERAPVLAARSVRCTPYAGRRACSTADPQHATLDGRAGYSPATRRGIPAERRHARHPPSTATTTRQA